VSVYIIAEVACEHLGSVDNAKRLIDIAVSDKADAVKFQYFYPDEVGDNVWSIVEEYTLFYRELLELKIYAEGQGIDWLCSAFGKASLADLAEVGLKTIKIPSPHLTDYAMLDVAGELFENFILSTGLHDEFEVAKATKHLNKWVEPKSVAILQCTSAYPCSAENVNLNWLQVARNDDTIIAGKFGVSDHTLGYTIPIAATALGADVIEKHLTLSKANGGPDACCSLEPLEFMETVQKVRDTEAAMGNGIKKIEEVEKGLLWRKKY